MSPGTSEFSDSVELETLQAQSLWQYWNVSSCWTQTSTATENKRIFSHLKVDLIWVQSEFGAKVCDLSRFNQRSCLMLPKLSLSEKDQQNSLVGPLSKQNHIPFCHLSSCFGNFEKLFLKITFSAFQDHCYCSLSGYTCLYRHEIQHSEVHTSSFYHHNP